MRRQITLGLGLLGLLAALLLAAQAPRSAQALWVDPLAAGTPPIKTPFYLPVLRRDPTPSAITCPTTSGRSYAGDIAYHTETDNPVRLASQHADKNLALRGYTLNSTTGINKNLINYGQDDPAGGPQLGGLFQPQRQVFPFRNVYTGNNWNWDPRGSAYPGTRGSPITDWGGVTLAGLQTTPGEAVYVPDAPGYNIGGLPIVYEVLVLYAEQTRITLKYTREDNINPGYAIHIENVCVDPNLLALYNSLDGGARYVVGSVSYNLPVLQKGQVLGLAKTGEIIVAIRDSGGFMDPRSCEWWWDYSAGGVTCTHP